MNNEKAWVDEIWKKICVKTEENIPALKDELPYMSIGGKYLPRINEDKKRNLSWWTNGFYGGLMWLLYVDTGKSIYRENAENIEKILDEAFKEYRGLHHDVGFMWHITSGVNYRLNNNESSFVRNIYAANLLAGRYNIKGGYIRAWNGDMEGYTIIDSMMNIPLLYWASHELKDERFKNIAMCHADMTAKCHIRPDGSVIHIVNHDPATGEIIETLAGQGASVNSSWSRGQAWAIYGFILSYIHTKKKEYLDIAKKVANYFIAAVCDDYLPRCDFRSPDEPLYYDSTAGAIAACGLLEIEKYVSEYEKKMYHNAAIRLLKSMEKEFCNWNNDEQAILTMGTESYGAYTKKNIPIIYGDYFFTEAFYKLRMNKMLFW